MRSMEAPTFSAPQAETVPDQVEVNPDIALEEGAFTPEDTLSTGEFLAGQHLRIKEALRDIHATNGHEISESDLETAATSLLLQAGIAAMFDSKPEMQPSMPDSNDSHDVAGPARDEAVSMDTIPAKSIAARQRRRLRRGRSRVATGTRRGLQEDDRRFEAELDTMVNYQWDPGTALAQTKTGTRQH